VDTVIADDMDSPVVYAFRCIYTIREVM
jgi:hypothetical protein